MDWSLIALLFAVGFALIGLGFLITTVHKVMSKPPPSQNIPPTPPPAPYLQPQQPPPPVYNWSLNGTRVQKLALGQGSSGSTAAPPPSTGGQIPGSGSEELESRLIPISYSVITPQIPVFEREPAHRATRVYEEPEPVPMPHSVAMPVDGDGLEPNAGFLLQGETGRAGRSNSKDQGRLQPCRLRFLSRLPGFAGWRGPEFLQGQGGRH